MKNFLILFFITCFHFHAIANSCDSTVTISCNGHSDSGGSMSETTEIQVFDCDGRLKQIVHMENNFGEADAGDFRWYTILDNIYYSYDTLAFADTIVTDSYFDSTQQIINREIIVHDSAGNVIEDVNQYNNSGNWINSYRYLRSYNSIGQPLAVERQNWNGTMWINQERIENYYSASFKLIQYNKLVNAAYDTLFKILYYYDLMDSLIQMDGYQPLQGTTTELVSTQLYFYDAGHRLSINDLYDVDSTGSHLERRYAYQYDSVAHTVIEYHLGCPDTSCGDTLGYRISAFSADSLVFDNSYFLNKYFVTLDTGYTIISHVKFEWDSLHRTVFQSDYSTNYPPPLYSEYNEYSYAYDTSGNLILSCYERAGSHIYDHHRCCTIEYEPGDTTAFAIQLYTSGYNLHCPNDPVPAFILISGGTPPYSISWNQTSGLSDSSNVFFNFVNTTTQFYSVAITDSTGLVSTDTITIGRNSFSVNISDSILICEGTAVELDLELVVDTGATNSLTFYWKMDGSIQQHYLQDSSFIPPMQGDYYIEAAHYSMCPEFTFQSNSFNVSFFVEDSLSLGNDTALCFGQSLLLDPGIYSTWLWQDSSIQQTFFVDTSGVFSVQVTDSNDCVNEDTIAIQIQPPVSVFLGSDTTLCVSQSILLEPAGSFISYVWQDSSTVSTYLASSLNPDTLIYAVLVTDQTGCTATDSIQIVFDICAGTNHNNETSIQIFPNPVRSSFFIRYSNNFQTGQLQIFNLIGEEVFSALLKYNEESIAINLEPGLYMIRTTHNGNQITQKLVVE